MYESVKVLSLLQYTLRIRILGFVPTVREMDNYRGKQTEDISSRTTDFPYAPDRPCLIPNTAMKERYVWTRSVHIYLSWHRGSKRL